MCSCPGPGTRPPCTRWSGPNPKGRPSWTCPTGSPATATPSSPRPCRAPATSAWRSTPPAAWTCGGCPPPSCGPSATGSAACWTRPPGTGRGSLRGPVPAGPRPTRPWSSSPPTTTTSARAGGCFACAGGPGRPAPDPGAVAVARQQADRAPTPSWRCASISSAGPAGWRPTPTSAPPTARSCGSWPGSAAPPAWPPSTTRPATSAASSARCPSPPGGGGPGGRPPPRSRTTAAAYGITDPDQALGPVPREPAQRAAWQQARTAAQRIQEPPAHRPPPGAHGSDPPSPHRPQPARPRPRPRRAGGRTPAWPGAGRRLAPRRRPAMPRPHPTQPDPDGRLALL